jgi:hypothetical protein
MGRHRKETKSMTEKETKKKGKATAGKNVIRGKETRETVSK